MVGYFMVEILKYITLGRSRMLEKLNFIIPGAFFESNLSFHGICIFCTLTIIMTVYSQIRSLTLFSMHPLCMSIGVLIFLSEGIVAYRNISILETLSPIMQSNKKSKARKIHQTMQITAASFMILGIAFIITEKVELESKSLWPESIHALIGIISIIMLILQLMIGMQKQEYLEWNNTQTKKWHGDAGLLLWDLLCITIIFGLYEFFYYSIFHIFVICNVIIIWLTLHLQMRKKFINHDDVKAEASLHERGREGRDDFPLLPFIDDSTHNNVEEEFYEYKDPPSLFQ